MDGSPSASDSDSESFEHIARSRPSDTEEELNGLRARAYGPEPDIDADPAALARLIELETAHAAARSPLDVPTPPDGGAPDAASTPPLVRESVAAPAPQKQATMIRATPRENFERWLRNHPSLALRREWFVLGSIVVAAMLGSVVWLLSPHPDATLRPTESDGEGVLFPGTPIVQEEDPDPSTLRQFERYHDIDVWSVQVSSVENRSGDTCLLVWDRRGGRFQYECLATGLEPAVHLTVVAEADDRVGEWLADGDIISFHLREDTVDVFVHSPPGAP